MVQGSLTHPISIAAVGARRRERSRGAWSSAAALLAGAVAALLGPAVHACTRALSNVEGQAVVVSRTMDWPESTEPELYVFPRGLARDGALLGSQTIDANGAKWTSKYGSMATSVYGLGSADGFNEAGLGAHMLFLTATDFGPREAARPALHAGLWAQYVLDLAGSVGEAIELLKDVQIVKVAARGRETTVHLVLEDKSGDSAVIEFVGGRQIVHRGRDVRVVTNDPPYDEQIKLLDKLDFSKPSSFTPLPGNVNPVDRFQRASYFVDLLPKPKDERAAIAGIMAVARNVSVPFGAPYHDFGIYNTEYRTAINLTNLRYYFEFADSPNLFWADLGKFDLSPGAGVMVLNPDDIELSGDVSAKFVKAERAPY